MRNPLTLVAISDTHSLHRHVKLPDGDVLIHAGDFMNTGRNFHEVTDFANWFMNQPHKYKILVAGNHDILMEQNRFGCLEMFKSLEHYTKPFYYLQDSSVVIEGWKFWGSPYQPEFFNWAFNRKRGYEIRKHWDLIPEDTDVLITHGPPLGIGDETEGGHYGCADLLVKIQEVKPALHICGHFHAGHGTVYRDETSFHNVSICNEKYKPVNAPHVIKLEE